MFVVYRRAEFPVEPPQIPLREETAINFSRNLVRGKDGGLPNFGQWLRSGSPKSPDLALARPQPHATVFYGHAINRRHPRRPSIILLCQWVYAGDGSVLHGNNLR
jgi:hypothetical protein